MSVTHPAYRVAVVQAAPVFLDLQATIDKSIDLMRQASEAGARLIAFPETFLPGYPFFLWLGTPFWGMQFAQRYHDNSLIIDSPEYKQLEDAARRYSIYLSMGYSEKSAGSLYMGQALIDDKGVTISARRKLKPTLVERALFGEGDGSDLSVHATEIGNVGQLCCWEHLQPLSKYAMYSQNEQVHIAAWPAFSLYDGIANALSSDVNNAVSKVYAVEGQCFVLAPSAVATDEIVDQLCLSEEARGLFRAGGGQARIYGPDGSSLATPLGEFEEGLLYADIDISTITLAKIAADPSGHYSRPDVTQLVLNKTPRRPTLVTQNDPQPTRKPLASVEENDAETLILEN